MDFIPMSSEKVEEVELKLSLEEWVIYRKTLEKAIQGKNYSIQQRPKGKHRSSLYSTTSSLRDNLQEDNLELKSQVACMDSCLSQRNK